MKKEWRTTLALLALSVRMGFRRSLANKALIFGSFVTYTVLMIIYSGVIRMFPEAQVEAYGFTYQKLIWYLATGELMVFLGSSWAYRELQDDVQEGRMDAAMIRPLSPLFLRCGIWYGEGLTRFLFLLPFYLLLMSFLAGGFVFDFWSVLHIALAIPLSLFMVTCAIYAVGLSCLWLSQAEPVAWLWEKSVFLLGAMLWPLALYPDWLQVLAWLTPFPALVAVAAQAALAPSWLTVAASFAHQLFWAVLFGFFLLWFDKKALRRLQEGEGMA